MKRYLPTFVIAIALLSLGVACATGRAPAKPSLAIKPLPGSDTVPVPLDELGTGTYRSIEGGLYPGGVNLPPADHDAAGIARRNLVRALDVNGLASATGRYVLMSIGAADASAGWCSRSSAPPCDSWSFTGRAVADTGVNHGQLVIVNGAMPGSGFEMWSKPGSTNYNRIRDTRLAPLGLSEKQVQVVWMSIPDTGAAFPILALPSDARVRLQHFGETIRALKTRYPNLQLLFISSGVYGGYSAGREPDGYESGFVVKWVIESQISQRRDRPPTAEVGDLRHSPGSDPWVAWGPYPWTRGGSQKRDGLVWLRSDFDSTGTELSQTGESKLGLLLFEFFRTSPYTRCWLAAAGVCG